MKGKYKANSLWYRERDQQIIKSFNDGASLCDLARRWQLEESTIREILKHYGILTGRRYFV